jgi:hypothetical protein
VHDRITTFVFGAGASKDAGYPLASSMGQELVEWMEASEDFRSTATWLKDRFDNPTDIESVLTEMDDILAREERSSDSTLIANVHKPAITQALRSWFLQIRERQEGSYSSFSSQVVQQGDAVISFNCDDALERSSRFRIFGH